MSDLNIISAADLMIERPPLPRPENPATLTLAEIIEIEPRITEALNAIKPFRGDWHKYFTAKKTISKLVGWSAETFELRTSQAFDVVMKEATKRLRI